jgi:hypothetical protein
MAHDQPRSGRHRSGRIFFRIVNVWLWQSRSEGGRGIFEYQWGCVMSESSSARIVRPSSRRTADFRSQKIRTERRRKFFRALAKHAYPRQTANELRRLTKDRYGERTIYDWIAGRSDAPLSVCIHIMGEILAD